LKLRNVQRIALACMTLAASVANAADERPLLARIFSDHVVLQRNRPIEIWGQAQPGEQVTVSMGGASRGARADNAGAWAVTLPARGAGGPHALTASTATRQQTVKDVLIGDVWLCSGQSNMEFKVRDALNATWEVQHSANNLVRHVYIPRLASAAPRADFPWPIEWKVAGPGTTQDFSAVCYYFARELERTASVDVPQGLIHASWGGTRIETWLSREKLRELGGNDSNLDLLAEYASDKPAAMRHWGESFQKWWLSQPVQGKQPWVVEKNDSADWKAAPSVEQTWEEWGVPALAEYDGMMWYRARVTLTKAQAAQAATLAIGEVNDVDIAWINGRAMGASFGEGEHAYAVPAKLLKAGENVVVLNVFDMWGTGGLSGPASGRQLRFADGTRVALDGWQYQVPPAGLSVMSNTMLSGRSASPLTPPTPAR